MVRKILDNLKIASLNKMQEASIEASQKENDILLLSPTGSGKTLAFLLPLLNRLDPDVRSVQSLILVPSRELALQIEQVFKMMNTGFKINCCYGGHSTKTEKNNLSHPPAVLVGTPGRIAYHIDRANFNTEHIHTLILDEFDKALELGFQDDMSFIISNLRKLKVRVLTSATNMDTIPAFTGIKKPVELNFLNTDSPTTAGLQLKYLQAPDADKLEILFGLICKLQNKTTLVFCNHREAVERISALLTEKGLSHGIFHGGMEQEDRERELIKFRNGSHRMLITTDLASRGLDIPEIEAVIHYQLPASLEIYTHRNGRTARMNAKGTSYLLLSAADHIPPFITEAPEKETLPSKNILPEQTPWRTLYIGAGKKDKINKMDIVGMLLQKGKLEKDELGLVEVLDYSSYASVNTNKIEGLVKMIKNEKIKNKKVKLEISR
ncbi:MAG: DEAD/DEAH box helicase [Bacteroidota bacterium]